MIVGAILLILGIVGFVAAILTADLGVAILGIILSSGLGGLGIVFRLAGLIVVMVN